MKVPAPSFHHPLRRRLLWAIGLTIFNIIVFNLFIRNGGYDLSGKYVPYSPQIALKTSLSGLLWGVPLLCILLGAAVALIPMRGRSYAQRFKRLSLAMMISINGVMGVMLLLIAIGTFLGFYPQSRMEAKSTAKNDPVILQLTQEIKALCDSVATNMDILLVEAADGHIASRDFDQLDEFKKSINEKLMKLYEQSMKMKIPATDYDSIIS